MSAYMVDRSHIAYLLEAAMSHDITGSHFLWHWGNPGHSGSLQPGEDQVRLCEVGQMLWDANKESIMARYPDTRENFDDAPGPIDETFTYDEHAWNCFGRCFDPVQVIKACNCFDYQACEYSGWRESEAKAFIESLIHHAISTIPGYKDAEWGAPEPKQPIRMPACRPSPVPEYNASEDGDYSSWLARNNID